ncbi:AMP-binding protein [Janibacter limosus]|uniref:AMP-binding protein n=1 Tax=Janibacter limosus TaxID=53458 RepID=A0AC61U4X1_9MICO|nr:AMP-binding protein [Janibacter limosus]UUZ45084.1 AMP-binding protein [Janibacter limosus]
MSKTEMDTARANGLGEVLRRSAARFRDKTAIIDGETRWSFRELDAIVSSVAAGLAQRGVAKGDRVALLSRNSAEFAAIAWGTARLGAILVPINFMLTADEVGWILGDAEPVAFIAQPEFVATAQSAIESSGQEVTTRIVSGEKPRGGPPSPISSGPTPPAGRPPTSPTTTRSVSCTPPAPSPGRRERCSPPARCRPSTSARSSTAA